MAETPDKGTQEEKQPEAVPQVASSRMPAILISLAALAVVGAATANALPTFHLAWPGFALPNLSWPKINRPSLPNFSGYSLPNFDRFTTQPRHETATVRIPDPVISAALRDIQLSQKDAQQSEQQNGIALASLTQSAANQQADLKRISRQLAALSTQVETLQGAVAPLTTSSIARPKPRARVALTQRKMPAPPALSLPPLAKPVGPVSVGGAPLSPAPASAPGAG